MKIDSDEFNPSLKYTEQYLRWRERVGVLLSDVLIMKNENNQYIPMGIKELRAYARMFSVFLGREFIIC